MTCARVTTWMIHTTLLARVIPRHAFIVIYKTKY